MTKIRWDGDLGILTGPTGQSYKPWDRRLGTWGLGPLSAHNSGPGSPRTKVVKVATKTLIHLHIQLGFGMPAASFVSLVISRDIPWSSATLIIFDTSLTILTACSPSLEFLGFLGFHAYKWRHHQQTLGAPRCYLSMSTDCTFAIQKLDALQLHPQCSNHFRNWTMMNSSIYLHDPGCKHL